MVFILSALWWIRDLWKLPDGRDWLWVKLGLGLVGRAMLSSVQFSCSVISDSLWPHGLQHTRLPCPSPTSRVYSNSCPLSRWCHPTISSSVIPFSSCLQSFPTSGSFQIIQLFTSGGQNSGVSASTSVLPMNIQAWFPLGWSGFISLQSRECSHLTQLPFILACDWWECLKSTL